MIIKKINWIDSFAEEALLTVEGGGIECLAYSQPCRAFLDEEVRSPLLCFDVTQCELSENTGHSAHRLSQSVFSYDLVGVVLDIAERLVRVGELLFELDCSIPGDVNVGSCIKFSCKRIDYIS